MLELYHAIKDYLDLTKEEPKNVALGAALAAFLAFVPLKCGLVALIVFIIGMTEASGTVAAILTLVLKPVSVFALDDASVTLGQKVLGSGFVTSHRGLLNAPGIALLGLERHHVMGGLVLGLLACIPFFIIAYRLQKVIVRVREGVVSNMVARKRRRIEEKARKEGRDPVAALAEYDAPKPPKKPGIFGRILGVIRTINGIPLKKWIVAGILLGVFELFFAKPIMKSVLHTKVPEGLAVALGMVDPQTGKITQQGQVTFDESTFDFSVARGRLHIDGLQVTNPRNTKENLFSAKTIEAKVSFAALLRKQFLVELVQLDSPHLAVARQADGTLGIEPEPTAAEKAQAQANAAQQAQKAQDWATKGRDYLDRAKKKLDERKKAREDAKKAIQEGKQVGEKPAKPKTLGEVLERMEEGLPGEDDEVLASRWVVRKVELSNVAIDFQDPQNPTPSFVFDKGELLELAENRGENGKPTVLTLQGSIISPQKQPEGSIALNFTEDAPDLDASKPLGWKLHAELSGLDLHATDAFFANAIPLSFDKGTATLTVDAVGHGVDGDLDSNPKIGFKDVVAKARHPGEQIAGLDSTKVAEEVTNCGAFDLNDIHVTGSLVAPKVDTGSTLKDLVVQGGVNYAKKKAGALEQKAEDKAKEAIEKKIPGASDKLDEAKKKLGGGDLPGGLPNPFGK
ncbi:MAG TPA: DUF2062 domain-containing protein [Planctomycetota bacterium]|nr:DUF2062 domain-containing protein [Planctomycetota bacterium]